ncbi:hypothetical protein LOY49_12610 [Pseudomonas atacamensis]|uniref:hypothetical protein n=1 Tax=Pseudomonas TaxID=286 RepID=UPI0015A8F97F|nr:MULTISPECIES: hypothetical protein [Pseudomonas]UVK96124.1 hypothetical protein LOY49_12610 [Pseudomonas atacamensis]
METILDCSVEALDDGFFGLTTTCPTAVVTYGYDRMLPDESFSEGCTSCALVGMIMKTQLAGLNPGILKVRLGAVPVKSITPCQIT